MTQIKAALALALLRAGAEPTPAGYVLRATAPTVTRMEPNQALAFARTQFPPESRLRKCGYRLEQSVLTLTFDFPDAAQARYAEAIERARTATGWEIEVDPEANQGALNALVREVLPPEWQVVKGPAIYREGKRVAITVSSAVPTRVELNAACVRFQGMSGWELSATVAVSSTPTVSVPAAATPAATAWEINAAYAEIKRALAGSTLYRTSLKGSEITLGFISPRVGERYREQIEALSARIGWPLAISPQPNQNAIMDAARALVVRAGWTLVKGPSLFTDRAEVTVTVAEAPDEAARGEAAQAFTQQTGYRLIFGAPTPPPSLAKKTEPELEMVEIPAARIRLTAYQQSLTLDPEKSRKALERAQREGCIHPPLRVRRVRDGYVLLDGLYRLQAAQALGWERIAAVVE